MAMVIAKVAASARRFRATAKCLIWVRHETQKGPRAVQLSGLVAEKRRG